MNYALLSKSLAAQMSERKPHTDHDKNENRISKREIMMEFSSFERDT